MYVHPVLVTTVRCVSEAGALLPYTSSVPITELPTHWECCSSSVPITELPTLGVLQFLRSHHRATYTGSAAVPPFPSQSYLHWECCSSSVPITELPTLGFPFLFVPASNRAKHHLSLLHSIPEASSTLFMLAYSGNSDNGHSQECKNLPVLICMA